MVEAGWRQVDDVIQDDFILEAQCQQTLQVQGWGIELIGVKFVEWL